MVYTASKRTDWENKTRGGSVTALGGENLVILSWEDRSDIFRRWQMKKKRVAGSDMRNLWQYVPFFICTQQLISSISNFRNIICHLVCFNRHNTTYGIWHCLITRHKGRVFFATLNLWRLIEVESQMKKTHCFIQQDSLLQGFLLVSSLLINLFATLVCSLPLSLFPTYPWCIMNRHTHTHTPTQAVRKSQDMLLPLLLWW